MTEAVKAGNEGGRLQVPQKQLVVIATADNTLTIRRKCNALDICGVTTWDNGTETKGMGAIA